MGEILFVANDFPEEYLDLDGKETSFDWITFTVPASQLERQIPTLYERIIAQGKDSARILVIHGDSNGNFSTRGREALYRFQPDVIFCCHPADVRRVYPDLPIYGYTEGKGLVWRERTSKIVRLSV